MKKKIEYELNKICNQEVIHTSIIWSFLRLAESIDTATSTIETLSKIHVEGREFST